MNAIAVTTLLPGEVGLAGRGDVLETLLGSCVAIMLTDPRRTVGVMCHIVHARPAPASEQHNSAYADVALDRMIDLLASRDITASMCEAYVYGGGNMFPRAKPPLTVGDANARWALRTLTEACIPILEADVGGAVYRQVRWQVGPDRPQAVAVPV